MEHLQDCTCDSNPRCGLCKKPAFACLCTVPDGSMPDSDDDQDDYDSDELEDGDEEGGDDDDGDEDGEDGEEDGEDNDAESEPRDGTTLPEYGPHHPEVLDGIERRYIKSSDEEIKKLAYKKCGNCKQYLINCKYLSTCRTDKHLNWRSPDAMHARRLLEKNKLIAKKAAKTKRKNNPGLKALREIKHMKSTTDPVIPYAPFKRLVSELLGSSKVTRNSGTYSIRSDAVHALRVAAEDMLVREMTAALIVATHAKRVTIMVKDMRCVHAVVDVMSGEKPL
jgi:histone H3/H4